VALVMRLCRAVDMAESDPAEAAWARLLTPAVKYWICKTAPALTYEAMECLGGNGYVEEDILARLYREAPVNAIWEGSGNVMCLDVLRAFARDGEASYGVLMSLSEEATGLPGATECVGELKSLLADASVEGRARALVGRLALLAAAAALRASAPEIAEIFARTRLRSRETMWGSAELEHRERIVLLDRALPSA
jgi:putative acyl-CoA dehydrogenase